jgi:hypothetical protein
MPCHPVVPVRPVTRLASSRVLSPLIDDCCSENRRCRGISMVRGFHPCSMSHTEGRIGHMSYVTRWEESSLSTQLAPLQPHCGPHWPCVQRPIYSQGMSPYTHSLLDIRHSAALLLSYVTSQCTSRRPKMGEGLALNNCC